MKIIKEINKQPEHIRELFMWLCVVIVFSIIFMTGIRETNKKIAALVNPQIIEETSSAVAKENVNSPLAFVASYLGELKAGITDIFSFSQPVQELENKKTETQISPALLPLSEDKK